MLQLIFKDFRAYLPYQLLSLLVAFVMSTLAVVFMLTAGDQIYLGIFVVGSMLCSSMFSMVFMMMDESYGASEVYASLPVSRRQIVWARYLTSSVQILLVLAACILAAQPVAVFQESLDDPALQVIYHPLFWVMMLLLLLLVVGFSYPFYFKYGLGKGALILGLVQIVLIVVAGLAYYLFAPYLDLKNELHTVFQWLLRQKPLFLILLVTGVWLIMLRGSVELSVRLFQKRDL